MRKGVFRYVKPPLTFWGQFVNFTPECGGAMMTGRGVLVEPRIEIHFMGDKFVDVETFDVLSEAGIECPITGRRPPDIPGCAVFREDGSLSEVLCADYPKRKDVEKPITLAELKKLVGKNGGKRK